MLRFPNPGSTIDNFVSVYSAAFERLNGYTVNLDNIVSAVVAANLATSSGYMGEKAVARSTRADRSRDPLYNQLKMYAELFRTLGWLHPIPQSALNFTFTLLGKQVVAAGRDFWPLLEECVLGIVYPTPILTVRGDFDLRPFAFILCVMAACDGHLSRDEMIIGPLSAPSDRGQANLDSVVATIKAARKSAADTNSSVAAVSVARNIQVNTLQNYTRWPIALLRDLGWATRRQARFRDGRKYQTFYLTEKGQALADRVFASVDLRVNDAARLTPEECKALAVVAHFRMLERSGFDIAPVGGRLADAEAVVVPVLERLGTDGRNLLFSPFQSLSLGEIAAAFPVHAQTEQFEEGASRAAVAAAPDGRDDRSHLFVPPNMVAAEEAGSGGPDALRVELNGLLEAHGSIEVAAAVFAEYHARDTQVAFYPLVTHLFQILGYKSDYSRAGVNYQRWDAYVMVDGCALPIEIKSPTEEIMLSTKAVRQALENKVILLSRGGLETRPELASLIVGYRLPNERGEMSNLIDDVFKAFSLRLGVIDLTTLVHLALRAMRDGVSIDDRQLSQLRGFLGV
ncbi:hypothetical protein JWG42_14285 [Desulfoprunum benzoelyticum]|uniref:Restriction endonuclease n=1 Tax=Desulfoprunum benzoelyticum TaxID=1506996 RepID=A0A840V6M4_9BACT|nr:hypothetical protein [Desulfoprunum benzoelyticum]MBB5349570.1 hypothetical protein [Desulfoprunum benzoelyticum]MBM9531325.1 hypothetical protein [Desulfoprunum benzoelyticum]